MEEEAVEESRELHKSFPPQAERVNFPKLRRFGLQATSYYAIAIASGLFSYISIDIIELLALTKIINENRIYVHG